MANARVGSSAWSELAWTRWGFSLAFIVMAAVVWALAGLHRTQFAPSTYFLPEYSLHSTTPWVASWPAAFSEAAL